MRDFEERHGVQIIQAWGMTETSPIGSVANPPAGLEGDSHWRYRTASGKLVTPGLIDLHAHTFPYGSGIGIPADELVPFQGTTTAVSAGLAGTSAAGLAAAVAASAAAGWGSIGVSRSAGSRTPAVRAAS